jgi:hypothetical protein
MPHDLQGDPRHAAGSEAKGAAGASAVPNSATVPSRRGPVEAVWNARRRMIVALAELMAIVTPDDFEQELDATIRQLDVLRARPASPEAFMVAGDALAQRRAAIEGGLIAKHAARCQVRCAIPTGGHGDV